jgi:hypothetical protein
MSIETERNRVAQLQKEKARLEKALSAELDSVRKKRAEIGSIQRSITKNTSVSMLQSKQRQIESKEKQLSSYEKKAADLHTKLASKDADILRILSNIQKLESFEQKKRDREESIRRDASLRHAREMTREMERQARLHNQLSTSPITVNFEKLPEKIVVLFIASNPLDQSQLRLDEEIRAISRKIRASEYRDSVELRSVWAARPTDLLQALNEHKPTVVHFSGHGSDTEELVLQDDAGGTKVVSKQSLVEMFKFVSSGIELVVFNTCFSENQASEVTSHVSAAIGMNTSIGDDAARVFAAQLYSAIGFGKHMAHAFGQAKVALMLEGIPEENTPQLFLAPGVCETELVLVRPV